MLLAASIDNYGGVRSNFIAYHMPMRVDRLEQAMDDEGFNQTSLAEAVGATQGAIQQILSGRTKRSRLLPDIADALGVSVQWLIGKSDDRTPPAQAPAAPAAEGEKPLPIPSETQLAEVLEALAGVFLKGVEIEDRTYRSAAAILHEILEEYARNPTGFADRGQLRTLTAGWSNLSRRLAAAGR